MYKEGTLSAEQRADLAKGITRTHVAISGEPANFVRVIFERAFPDSIFSGGKPAVNANIMGIIRGPQYRNQNAVAERSVVPVQACHESVG